MPVSADRRGVTLAETLVGLALLGMVGGLLVRLTLAAERTTRSHEERARLHSGFDAALGYLASEMGDLGAGDLQAVAADTLRYRATRGVGLACAITASEVRVLASRWNATRAPQPGRDSLLLSLAPDLPGALDSGWVSAPVLGVGTGNCAGAPALTLATAIDTAVSPLGGQSPLTPVRLFEIMEARLYASAGDTWLGARSVSAGEVIQPLAGPFTPAGSRFEPRDSLQVVTPVATDARSVRVTLRGLRGQWPASAVAVPESARMDLVPVNVLP